MIDKTKAPVSAATLTGAGTKMAACRASSSEKDYSTFEGQNQGRIASLLPQGEGNAITTRELLRITGFSCARALQIQIEAERHNGALILSSSRNGGGYYLPSDGPEGEREITDFVQTLQARALNTLRTLRSAKQALRRLDGQTKIEEV